MTAFNKAVEAYNTGLDSVGGDLPSGLIAAQKAYSEAVERIHREHDSAEIEGDLGEESQEIYFGEISYGVTEVNSRSLNDARAQALAEAKAKANETFDAKLKELNESLRETIEQASSSANEQEKAAREAHEKKVDELKKNRGEQEVAASKAHEDALKTAKETYEAAIATANQTRTEAVERAVADYLAAIGGISQPDAPDDDGPTGDSDRDSDGGDEQSSDEVPDAAAVAAAIFAGLGEGYAQGRKEIAADAADAGIVIAADAALQETLIAADVAFEAAKLEASATKNTAVDDADKELSRELIKISTGHQTKTTDAGEDLKDKIRSIGDTNKKTIESAQESLQKQADSAAATRDEAIITAEKKAERQYYADLVDQWDGRESQINPADYGYEEGSEGATYVADAWKRHVQAARALSAAHADFNLALIDLAEGLEGEVQALEDAFDEAVSTAAKTRDAAQEAALDLLPDDEDDVYEKVRQRIADSKKLMTGVLDAAAKRSEVILSAEQGEAESKQQAAETKATGLAEAEAAHREAVTGLGEQAANAIADGNEQLLNRLVELHLENSDFQAPPHLAALDAQARELAATYRQADDYHNQKDALKAKREELQTRQGRVRRQIAQTELDIEALEEQWFGSWSDEYERLQNKLAELHAEDAAIAAELGETALAEQNLVGPDIGVLNGLRTGAKGLARGAVRGAVSVGTLGFVEGSDLADQIVGKVDPSLDLGIGFSEGTGNLVTQFFLGLATGAAGGMAKCASGARALLGKAALGFDVAGSVLDLGRAGLDVWENGLTAGNLFQALLAASGLAGNHIGFTRTDGCFAPGTPVWMEQDQDGLPDEPTNQPQGRNQDEPFAGEMAAAAVVTRSRLRTQAIESVALGSRVASQSPRPLDYDHSLPEPIAGQEHAWRRLDLSVSHEDGRTVAMQVLRPAAWVARHRLAEGSVVRLPEGELGPAVAARVESVGPCPPIAAGTGAVVTGRFVTAGGAEVADLTVETEEGQLSTLRGTPAHPVWSQSRGDWTALSDLRAGEAVRTAGGTAVVLSVAAVAKPVPVWNLEVHGHHTYHAGAAGLLVHNAGGCDMDSVRQIGMDGEDAAGIVKNTKRTPSYTGKADYRIPDEIDDLTETIREIKNVKRLYFSSQLRDFLYHAMATGYDFEIVVRKKTSVASSILELERKGYLTIDRSL